MNSAIIGLTGISIDIDLVHVALMNVTANNSAH